MSPQEILAEHVVDIHKVVADFRDAFETIQSSSSQSYGVNKYFSSQSLVQKRLSIYNRNPGPRRGKMLLRNKSQGNGTLFPCKKHLTVMITKNLHERIHVTHYVGCAILFNMDTFYPDINIKAIYLHDSRRGVQDHIVEGEQGWELQGVLARASFGRTAVSGQKFSTVLSLHISNIYAKK